MRATGINPPSRPAESATVLRDEIVRVMHLATETLS
jgi:hypothetical protein